MSKKKEKFRIAYKSLSVESEEPGPWFIISLILILGFILAVVYMLAEKAIHIITPLKQMFYSG